jgi:hypothetical protein
LAWKVSKERFCFWVGANSPSDNRAIQRET